MLLIVGFIYFNPVEQPIKSDESFHFSIIAIHFTNLTTDEIINTILCWCIQDINFTTKEKYLIAMRVEMGKIYQR